MAERSNAAVLKTVDPKGPGVRIPLSPQKQSQIWGFFYVQNLSSSSLSYIGDKAAKNLITNLIVILKNIKIINYRSVIGLYFGTNDFITDHATKYAKAQIANMMV